MSLLYAGAALLMLAAEWAVPASGQSALDGFDPNANGSIRALVVQADGKIVLGDRRQSARQLER
jgi:hypothetical protein